MSARYIIRMDDITPTMDWGRFWAILKLLNRRRIKPLLGVVPDNQDPNLVRQAPDPRFWDTLRLLVERDLVEIAQHGYQHVLSIKSGYALLKPTHGSTVERSEFAGYSFNEQLSRIVKGQTILKESGLDTRFWFAPNHSFDHTTIHALHTAGFTAVSDGISLSPYRHLGIIFVPQQLWRPKRLPTGVFTICLHSNSISNREIHAIRQFLRTPVQFTSFGHEVRTFQHRPTDILRNSVFKAFYQGAREAQRTIRWGNGLLRSSFKPSSPAEVKSPEDKNSPLSL